MAPGRMRKMVCIDKETEVFIYIKGMKNTWTNQIYPVVKALGYISLSLSLFCTPNMAAIVHILTVLIDTVW